MRPALRGCLAAALGLALLLSPGVQAACRLQKLESLPVEVEDNVPLIKGTLNGQPIRILIATGVAQSFLLADAADRLGLKRRNLDGVRMIGLGGALTAQVARVDEFHFAGPPSRKFNVLVADPGRERGYDFLLGQDILAQFELELDLANKVINFFVADGCEDADLAYWKPGADWVSLASLEGRMDSIGKGDIQFWTELNGVRLRTMLNTTAAISSVTLWGARRAGVSPETAGVLPLQPMKPDGRKVIDQWAGIFDRFTIGGETIQNAKLAIADIYKYRRRENDPRDYSDFPEPDNNLILGGDFLLAHRVLVSSSQRRLYFTYNGGPVFQVRYQSGADTPDNPAGAPQ